MMFQRDLLEWYKKEARVLPWRSDPTPYKVWISEMMLQQTRVDTVIPYFLRFIEELPDVESLAKVEEDKLLKLWQGLGYYNRAMNLKKAAQQILELHGGRIPENPSVLQGLPGIGPYSSGAIASIAFDKQVPAVDGNVLRIMIRISGERGDMKATDVKKRLVAMATDLVPPIGAGDFNQALMDLGATICLPNGEPKCGECPVSVHCLANHLGIAGEIPMVEKKKPRLLEKKTVLVITDGHRYALTKRVGNGLLPNLWEFPNEEGHLNKKQCQDILSLKGIKLKEISELKPSRHIFSHREWLMTGFLVVAEADPDSSNEVKTDLGLKDVGFTWVSREEIARDYSIPTAFKEYLKMLKI